MKTANKTVPEAAMIMANIAPVGGWNVYWAISKSQIEYMLTDVVSLPAGAEHPHLPRAQYQDEALPIIHLEKHFGLHELPEHLSTRYIVTKYATLNGKLARAILSINHPVRLRKVTLDVRETTPVGIARNSEDIFGVFKLPENQLVIVPHIANILKHS